MIRHTLQPSLISRRRVRRAIRRVPRRIFVPEEYRRSAEADRPLPIGWGQTISQPQLVEYMTALLELRPGDKVLEIGTGSGYQTAVLAALGDVEVYSVELIPELAAQAANRLRRLGFEHVHLRVGDGYKGWPRHAPYDGILVTAAPEHLPPPLPDQLADGGRLVIPIGPLEGVQVLWRFMRRGAHLTSEPIEHVVFVPLGRSL